MKKFSRFQLSSYETTDPKKEAELLRRAKEQLDKWLEKLIPNEEQKKQAQLLTGKVTKRGKEHFKVFFIIPLEEGQEFNAVWDAFLTGLRTEDIPLKLEPDKLKG